MRPSRRMQRSHYRYRSIAGLRRQCVTYGEHATCGEDCLVAALMRPTPSALLGSRMENRAFSSSAELTDDNCQDAVSIGPPCSRQY